MAQPITKTTLRSWAESGARGTRGVRVMQTAHGEVL
jgi:hypothetical protein